MNIVALFNALPGGCAQGLIWGIMAIGVFITYKILDLADLTVDGTMCTGGAVCVVMMMNGHSVGFSLFCAFVAGMLAGLVTGIFHTAMGIPAILAGILTQLGLYSVNLRIMGNKANVALVNVDKYDVLVSMRYLKNVVDLQKYAVCCSNCDRCTDRSFILVFRYGIGLFHPLHGLQSEHVPCTGHQYRHDKDHRSDAV